jgi:hypothetical protein
MRAVTKETPMPPIWRAHEYDAVRRHDSEAAAKSGVDEIAHGWLPLARTGTSSPKARRRLDFNWLNRGKVIAADVDLIPLAGKGLPDALLVPVDVRECAQLAVITHPGGEVDEVDGDLTLQLDHVAKGTIPRFLVGARFIPTLVFP